MSASAQGSQNLSKFDNDSIDIVTCSFDFTFFPKPVKVFTEIHGVLKPGGSLIAIVWNTISLAKMPNRN